MKSDASTRVEVSLLNYSVAVAQLQLFLATPIVDDRDRAGVIQAFEFCFELAWKTIKKLAESEGLEVATPVDAFRAGFQMGLIKEKEHSIWLEAKKTRNLTSHTYKQELALQVLESIQSTYLAAFIQLEDRLKQKISN